MIPLANITLSLPDNIYKKMKHFSEVRWSEVARKAIINKIEVLEIAEKLASKSKLTKKDVEEFSNKIKSDASERFLG